MEIDANELGSWIKNGQAALDFIKSAKNLLPRGKDTEKLNAIVQQAEEALKRSDAALAKELGYPICHCQFPPPIMLWRQSQQQFACPNDECRKTLSKPSYSALTSATPRAKGSECPSCGAYEYRVIKSAPHELFGDLDGKNVTRRCATCNFEDTNLESPKV